MKLYITPTKRSRLSRIVAVSLVLVAFGSARAQQTAPALDARHAMFYDHLFLKIANLEDKQSDLQRRQVAATRQYGMSSSEASALYLAAQSFQTGLGPIRNAKNAILAQSNGNLTNMRRAQLAQLAARRAVLVNSVAEALLGSLSPATAARINATVQLIK